MVNSGVISSRHRGEPFVSVWETTSINETVTLPYSISGTYNGFIDWGDGTITPNTYAERSHQYNNIGVYTIKITGVINDFMFNLTGDFNKIKNVSNFGTNAYFGTSAFFGCSNLDITSTEIPFFNNNLTNFFRNCSSLVYNTSINNWDVSSVTLMQLMFRGATSFNQPLNNWDTSNVSVMANMFRGATSFNQDISSWDFSSVINLFSFMTGKSDLNYDATFYDNLLKRWNGDLDNGAGALVFSNMVNVNISMGTIKYTSAGAAARASLVTKGFIITDGGLV